MPKKPLVNSKFSPQPMVQWFNPILLVKLGWQVVVSALFGKYADHRVIHAALDEVSPATHLKRADLTKQKVFNPDKDGAIWIDYVADLGEGFNSTYAMASLLAEPTLKIGTQTLPRGDILIMGGDEVYPTASRDEYQVRTRQPYELAFPNSKKRGAKHPRLYAIPGNHDWYDGLDAFSGIFCRFRDKKPWHGGLSLGSWRCKQTRSYFALKLTDDCWLWGLDIQLKGYVDQPQINYFKLMADELSKTARVIVCTAQPSWLKAEKPGDQEYRSLNYIARLIDDAKGQQKVSLMIAGDIHHYSRYSEENSGMQFVTAGGGGAFLHPTHQLQESLVGDWVGEPVNLRLARDSSNPQKDACYPDKETSKNLLTGNWKFIASNWDFCIGLGVIFGVLANFLVVGDATYILTKMINGSASFFSIFRELFLQTFSSTSSVTVAVVVIAIMTFYADTKHKIHKLIIGLLHGATHLLILVGFTTFFQTMNAVWFGLSSSGFVSNFVLFTEMAMISFVLAGIVWGAYLSITCWLLGIHTNDGFSAMQIADYKNFLRIRIKQDEITIFPIGLETVPKSDQWFVNDNPSNELAPQTYVAIDGLSPHLIEAPITIETGSA